MGESFLSVAAIMLLRLFVCETKGLAHSVNSSRLITFSISSTLGLLKLEGWILHQG